MSDYITTPISQIPIQYKSKFVTDPKGNKRTWDEVLETNPNYPIITDANGVPINHNQSDGTLEFGTEGIPVIAGTDLAGMADTENIRQIQVDNKINKGYGWGQYGKLALGELGMAAAATAGAWALGNPIFQGALNLWGAYEGGRDIYNGRFSSLGNNISNGKYYSALKDAGIGALDILGISMPPITVAMKPEVQLWYQLNKAVRNMPLSTTNMPLNVGWGPRVTTLVSHASDQHTLPTDFYPERFDVVNEGANPRGGWFQGRLGIPRTDLTNPGKGAKAAKARDLFANRPWNYEGELTLEKPLVTVGTFLIDLLYHIRQNSLVLMVLFITEYTIMDIMLIR